MKKIMFSIIVIVFVVLLAGCVNYKDNEKEIIEERKSYLVTIEKGVHLLYESLPEKIVAGEKVSIKTNILMDADCLVYVNDVLIEQTLLDEITEYWLYEFIMPESDVTIVIEIKTMSYLTLDGTYNAKMIARKYVLVVTDALMKISDDKVYFGENMDNYYVIELTYGEHDIAFEDLSYCTDYAESIVEKIAVCREYYRFSGYVYIPESVPSFYLFIIDDNIYYVHIVNNMTFETISVYELIKMEE
jgi:hypothetical protein